MNSCVDSNDRLVVLVIIARMVFVSRALSLSF